MREPYIGIVGVKNTAEAIASAEIVKSTLDQYPYCAHRAQIGVQVTTRTLRGEVTESRRNPKFVEIPGMFRAILEKDPDIWTAIHFTTKDHAYLYDFVNNMMQFDGLYEKGLCKMLQLNGQLGKASHEAFKRIKLRYGNLKIVVQLNHDILDKGAVAIVNELKMLDSMIDYVLIDRSGGRGEELKVGASLLVAKFLMDHTRVQVGFAGGLGEHNVQHLVPTLGGGLRTPDFSIDAEGCLRDKRGVGYGNDDFNHLKAQKYFSRAVLGFSIIK